MNIFIAAVVLFICSNISYAQLEHPQKSTHTLNTVIVSSVVAAGNIADNTERLKLVIISSISSVMDKKYSQINSAISEMNYKIAYLSSNCNTLDKQIEELKVVIQNQKKVNETIAKNAVLPLEQKLKDMEISVSLMRTNLTQLQEDMALLKTNNIKDKEKDSQDSQKWYKSYWVAVGAAALSFIAIIK
jgi:chromosome segregation ATPase